MKRLHTQCKKHASQKNEDAGWKPWSSYVKQQEKGCNAVQRKAALSQGKQKWTQCYFYKSSRKTAKTQTWNSMSAHRCNVNTSLLWTVYSAPKRVQFPLLKNWFKSVKFLFFCIISANLLIPSTFYTVLHYAMIDLIEPVKYEFPYVCEEIKIRVDKHSTEETGRPGQCGKQIQWTNAIQTNTTENLLRHLLQNMMKYI